MTNLFDRAMDRFHETVDEAESPVEPEYQCVVCGFVKLESEYGRHGALGERDTWCKACVQYEQNEREE